MQSVLENIEYQYYCFCITIVFFRHLFLPLTSIKLLFLCLTNTNNWCFSSSKNRFKNILFKKNMYKIWSDEVPNAWHCSILTCGGGRESFLDFHFARRRLFTHVTDRVVEEAGGRWRGPRWSRTCLLLEAMPPLITRETYRNEDFRVHA